ncbi:MAG: glutamate-1-semialdehyde 2,1-aminomutase [Trueperaceae bacterium]
MDTTRSEALFARALAVTPGGVNSPVRAFGSVGGTPRFLARGSGPHVWDVDGNRYVDMIGSWGPLLLGHAHPAVVAAVRAATGDGTSFGAPGEREVILAEAVLDRYPTCDTVRFVNSGTEATMSALRLARGFTGRDLVVKFEGNYHGHADGLLVAAGSGAATTGVPSSAGVPAGTAATTLVAPYNDLPALEAVLDAHAGRVAAVILEPVVGNMGVVPPEPEFHEGVRALTRRHGALLVIDEVMTGFRLARGGAVERLRLEPDLVTWGKVIGGGLPVGAYGGRGDVMSMVSPLGPVYQAGTLSGNPLAMAAGIATLDAIDAAGDVYARMEASGDRLQAGLEGAAHAAGVAARVQRVGSMLTVFFTDRPVRDFRSATSTDTERFARWFHAMLDAGISWPPSAYEAAFLSTAHDDAAIDAVLQAAAAAFEAAA